MKHYPRPSRYAPDDATRAELDAIGLGDPSAALRERAVNDLFFVGLVFLISLFLALAFDLGELFHTFVREHEDWELDEFVAAALFSLVAFAWFSWRQWYRYSDEVSRRLKLEESVVEMRLMTDQFGTRKSDFLANLAHDLRTPLNGIVGFSQLLRDEAFGPLGNERYKTYAETIHENAAMLNERIDTCLDPEKIEFGAEPMQMLPYPLKNAVNAALPILEPIARTLDIALHDRISNDLPEIHCDSRALRKIIIVLVTNAIKRGQPKGNVTISATATPENTLALVIEDDGIGMTRGQVMAMLDDNSAGPDTTTEPHSGVSFPAIKKLLELHGATMLVDTHPGKGTTVTVTFPGERLVGT